MANHPDIDALTALFYHFADDELSEARTHVASCRECRQVFARLQRENALIRDALAPRALPERFAKKVCDAIPSDGGARRRWLRRSAIAAAILLSAAAAYIWIGAGPKMNDRSTAVVPPAAKEPSRRSGVDASAQANNAGAPVGIEENLQQNSSSIAETLKVEYRQMLEDYRRKVKDQEETIAKLNEELKNASENIPALLYEQERKIEEMNKAIASLDRHVRVLQDVCKTIDELQNESKALEEERTGILATYRTLLAEEEGRTKRLVAEIREIDKAMAEAGDPAKTSELAKRKGEVESERASAAKRHEEALAVLKDYEERTKGIETARLAAKREIVSLTSRMNDRTGDPSALWSLQDAVGAYETHVQDLRKANRVLLENAGKLRESLKKT